MQNTGYRSLAAALVLLAPALLAACSAFTPSGPGTQAQVDNNPLLALFANSGKPGAPAPTAAGPSFAASDPSLPCPPVEINPGAGSYRLFEKGKEGDVMSVRYQATVVRMARQCDGLGAEMAIKIGVMGRVVVGAKGGPGRVDVPLRIAVVDGRNQPVFSQLRTIPVDMPAGAGDTEFTHVEDNVLVPIDDTRLKGWRVLIGFDDKSANGPAKNRTSARPAAPDLQSLDLGGGASGSAN